MRPNKTKGPLWPLPPEVEHKLKRFLGRMLEAEDKTWTADERLWRLVFRKVARNYPQLTLDQSFGISFVVLCRCYSKKKHEKAQNFYPYLLRACRNAHKHELRVARRKPKKKRVPLDKRWPAPFRIRLHDSGLDFESVLAHVDPQLRQVVELMRGEYNRRRWTRLVAEQLNVNPRRAAYLLKSAADELRRLLGENHDE